MGKKSGKKTLNDLTRQRPTKEEREAARQAFSAADSSPIVAAILGQALIEPFLEDLLREKVRHAWSELENGPLFSFESKIIAAYALELIDDTTRKNLDTIRQIRNAFAHSKRLIDFDDQAVLSALTKVRGVRITGNGRQFFLGLCEETVLELKRRATERQDRKLAALRAEQLTLLGSFLRSVHSHTSGPNTPLALAASVAKTAGGR